jgi:hypothetical protein
MVISEVKLLAALNIFIMLKFVFHAEWTLVVICSTSSALHKREEKKEIFSLIVNVVIDEIKAVMLFFACNDNLSAQLHSECSKK